MATANLELVRSVCTAWERGDYSSTEWADPQIEFELAVEFAPGSWRGVAGMAEGWRDFLSAWEEHRIEVDQYQELDAERVLVLFTFRGRGKTSGLQLEQLRAEGASIFYVRAGKVTRLTNYIDREQALADLDVSEPGSPPA